MPRAAKNTGGAGPVPRTMRSEHPDLARFSDPGAWPWVPACGSLDARRDGENAQKNGGGGGGGWARYSLKSVKQSGSHGSQHESSGGLPF